MAGTKTFATQMVSQYLVALYLAQVRGSMFPEEIGEVLARMDELPAQIERTIGLHVAVRLVEPHSIQRSEGKAKRVFDQRNL